MVTSALVVLVAARALWLRRSTFRIPWELAGSLNVAMQAGEIILLCAPVAHRVGPWLHAVTGLWNMEDLTAHLLYIGGMAAMSVLVVSRLDMTIDEFRHFIRTRIELPGIFFVTIVATVFACAGYGERDLDLILMTQTLWSRAYFLLYIFAVGYLLTFAIPALLVIRRDRRQTRVANAYLGAVGVTILTCVALLADAIPAVTWFMVRAESAGYAFAAWYGWHVRIVNLRPKHPASPRPAPVAD